MNVVMWQNQENMNKEPPYHSTQNFFLKEKTKQIENHIYQTNIDNNTAKLTTTEDMSF